MNSLCSILGVFEQWAELQPEDLTNDDRFLTFVRQRIATGITCARVKRTIMGFCSHLALANIILITVDGERIASTILKFLDGVSDSLPLIFSQASLRYKMKKKTVCTRL